MARAGGKPSPHHISPDLALGAADIQRSLRFDSGSNAHLTRSVTTTGNQKIWTFSCWLKKAENGYKHRIYSCNDGNSGYIALYFHQNYDELYTYFDPGNNYGTVSSRKFRDTTSWMHIVHQVDATNTVQRIWINGEELSLNSGRNPGNSNYPMNKAGIDLYIGRASWSNTEANHANMYLAEVYLVDGSLIAPTEFGFTESQTGIWMPKRYQGTYGTNGFYLDFSDNSSTAALGIDRSPNGNDFTVNNFSVTAGEGNDSLEDTPTNNFCTLNSLFMNGSDVADCSNGSLDFTADSNYQEILGTMSVKTGKWYWEVKPTSNPTNASPQNFGITRGTGKGENSYVGYDNNGNGYGYSYDQAGNVVGGGSGDGVVNGATLATGQTSFTQNDIIGVAVDIPNGYLIFYKNGAHLYTISGINSHDWFPAFSAYASGTFSVNFGQRPFSYTPPLGHKKLCAKNLPLLSTSPSVVRPQRHFDTVLYTGNSSTQKITGLEFKPDMIWFKSRTSTNGHGIVDSVRGRSKIFYPDTNQDEDTSSANRDLASFDDGGFTLGNPENLGSTNNNGLSIVAWCWKAGGATTVANTDGDQTTQVSVNEEAGFSIVTYTGTGSNTNIGHGLGGTPDIVITKSRSASGDWAVLDRIGNSTAEYGLFLNDNGGYSSYQGGTYWNDTLPTSTVFRVSSSAATNASGVTYMAYCWRSIPGYSKMGTYRGNGNSKGTSVYCGFRPAWLMIKRVNNSRNWLLFDNKRDTHNPVQEFLEADLTSTEATLSGGVDFLADGFKCVTSDTDVNANDTSGGDTYLFMAFAEQPGITPFDTFPNAR